MSDWWNNPPEELEPPMCCEEYMDITECSCVCSKCGKRIENEPQEVITPNDWEEVPNGYLRDEKQEDKQ